MYIIYIYNSADFYVSTLSSQYYFLYMITILLYAFLIYELFHMNMSHFTNQIVKFSKARTFACISLVFLIAFITLLNIEQVSSKALLSFSSDRAQPSDVTCFLAPNGPKENQLQGWKMIGICICDVPWQKGLVHACLRTVIAYSWRSVPLTEKKDQMCYRHLITPEKSAFEKMQFPLFKVRTLQYKTIVR